VLAAPYATMVLADLGAEVVKIEHPRGDETRAWGPPHARGEATYFLSVNRNKTSAVLDLSTADGKAAAREIALGADVVVENFRPGTMARFGLSYEDPRTVHPGLVYCSVTGFARRTGSARRTTRQQPPHANCSPIR
jgi:crotonobetainyl-CoA:carnitine CoA-transferase CaiB-like acyl-CoA transferase